MLGGSAVLAKTSVPPALPCAAGPRVPRPLDSATAASVVVFRNSRRSTPGMFGSSPWPGHGGSSLPHHRSRTARLRYREVSGAPGSAASLSGERRVSGFRGGGPPQLTAKPNPSQPLISLKPAMLPATGALGVDQPAKPARPVEFGVSVGTENALKKAGS